MVRKENQKLLVVLWPRSTSLKNCLIPPLSTFIHPSFTLFPFLSACLLYPHPPLWLPLSLYSSITLSYIHPSFDLCPYSCPCIHDRVYKALNLRDYLHRFPLLSPTPFSSLHASFTLDGCVFSTIWTVLFILAASHFLFLSIFLPRSLSFSE